MHILPVLASGWLYPILFLLGACIGSFLNVVVVRLPGRLQYQWQTQCRAFLADQLDPAADTADSTPPPGLVYPRSHCPQCTAVIRRRHNIPLVGYLLLAGKCADCGRAIPLRYPLIELLTAVITVQAGYVIGLDWSLPAALIFLWSLIALGAIDLEQQLLPDDITLPLLWLGLGVNLFGLFTPLASAVIGAMAGYASLWLLYQAHRQLTGREGMGYGDFKLLAAIGAWLGWQLLPLVVLLASVTGTLVVLSGILRGNRSADRPISFGPFLAVSAWVALLWGEQITRQYLRLLYL